MRRRDEHAAVVDALARVVIALDEARNARRPVGPKGVVERVAEQLGIHLHDLYDRVGEIDEEAAA